MKKNQLLLILSLFLGIVSIALAVKTETSIANSPASASENSGNLCAAQLPAEIDAVVNGPEFERARWGILVVKAKALTTNITTNLTPAKTLYALEANKYFTPASTAKLLTSAAALEAMNPNMRIRTSVYGPINGTINSTDGTVTSLRVVGRGDPSIQTAQLEALAQQLRDRGITQIDRLIGEDSYFQGEPINPNWEWEDIQAGYGARVNSLIFNQNAIDLILSPQAVGEPLRVTWVDAKEADRWQLENNSVTVEIGEAEFVEVGRDLQRPVIRVSGQLMVGAPSEPVYAAVVAPGDRFLKQFRDVLASQGIPVKQTLLVTERQDDSASEKNRELAAIESPPLSELVMEVNQESNNLYAEVLVRLLGVSIPLENNQEIDSSADKGLAVIKTTLTQLGVNPNSYVLADGSGLSRHNFISPEALVQTLQVMAGSERAPLYRNSLTLREFPGGIQVQSKSGGMTGISSLAGYVNSPDYDPLVFAIIVNYSDRSGTVRRQAIDRIIRLLTRLRHC